METDGQHSVEWDNCFGVIKWHGATVTAYITKQVMFMNTVFHNCFKTSQVS